MAEVLVENRVCKACGADVHPGSLFCYNCGKSVAPELFFDDNHKKDNIGEIRSFEGISVDGEKGDKLKPEGTEKIVIEKNAEPLNETITEKSVKKPEILEPVKLKSAANLRRKSKVLPKKKVEIVWEEQVNAPNLWFIVVALTLTIFAVVIILLALYIR